MSESRRSPTGARRGSPARGDARRGTAGARPRRDGDTRGPRQGTTRPRGDGDARPRRDDTRPRRDEARPRREGTRPRRDDTRPRRDDRGGPRHDTYASPRRSGFSPRATGSREAYAPRSRSSAPRSRSSAPREGFAPRSRAPREGYAPRSRSSAQREGFAPRSRAPREGYAPRSRSSAPRQGFAPRSRAPREDFRSRPRDDRRPDFRPRGEQPAPRAERRGPPSRAPERRTFERPRAERPRFERDRSERPRPERPRREAPSGERPRFEGAPSERPDFERPRYEKPRHDRPHPERAATERPRAERPRPERPERPRFDRPRAERPVHDEGGDQTGAVNRSRPIYPQGPNVRWRRDGKRSPSRDTWAAPQAQDRPRHANGGPEVRESRAPSRGPAAGHHRPAVGPAVDGPSLPADPREAALRILHAVDTRSAFSDRLLDGAHARPGADPRDRALLHELVKGALRWRGRIDAALDARVHVGLANTQPWIRNILRLGAYQILFLDRIPAHAAVDESVKLAHKYAHAGAAGLVNSVLRRLAEERDTIRWPEGDDATSLAGWGSHPLWMVERWLARFGPEETRALLSADNRAVPTGLRANTLKNTRPQLIQMLAGEGVEARPGKLSPDLVWVEGHHSPGALHSFRAGLCTAQDESEALVGRVVAPQPHERVLDLCAAPGGKSTHLAELMRDDGEVWAMERDAHRVETLKSTLERLGTHSVHVVHGDGRTYEFPMPFDRVLVDAPCSGMGVLARRADARWRKGPEVLAEMPPVQLDLLRSAGQRLVPGGLLVYSVCSFEPEETDHVVARFLAEHPGWRLESVAGAVPAAVVTPEGFMRTLPHQHGCDGAFAARMRKP